MVGFVFLFLEIRGGLGLFRNGLIYTMFLSSATCILEAQPSTCAEQGVRA